MKVVIAAKTSVGMTLEIEPSFTVRQLKALIQTTKGISQDKQTLYLDYQGSKQKLDDSKTLSYYGLRDGAANLLYLNFGKKVNVKRQGTKRMNLLERITLNKSKSLPRGFSVSKLTESYITKCKIKSEQDLCWWKLLTHGSQLFYYVSESNYFFKN